MAFPKELGIPSHLVAELKRCAYGTRDAGAIWEHTYRLALESMGFISGSASPCCFHHPGRSIAVVVHGDDFTALGIKADLDWYETSLAEHFELKLRGRLGENVEGPRQLKILNRIITLTDTGSQFEADPRHVDLLANSMGLTLSNAVSTPGVEDPEPDYAAQKSTEPEDISLSNPFSAGADSAECIQSITQNAIGSRHLSFSPDEDIHEIPAYSTTVGRHPRFIFATKDGWREA